MSRTAFADHDISKLLKNPGSVYSVRSQALNREGHDARGQRGMGGRRSPGLASFLSIDRLCNSGHISQPSLASVSSPVQRENPASETGEDLIDSA